jgi:hypothetical protein
MAARSFADTWRATSIYLGGIIALLLAVSVPVSAATLFSNPDAPDNESGTILSYAVGADDFMLDQDARIEGATIVVTGAFGGDVSRWDGSGEFGIFSSTLNGLPDDLLLHGAAQNVVLSTTEVMFDFGQDFMAAANTSYFLAFHAKNVLSGHNAISWAVAVFPGTSGANSTSINFFSETDRWNDTLIPELDGVTDWTVRHPSAIRVDKAFSLQGEYVPEPGTGTLLAAGLAGLSARRRSGSRS